MTTAFAIQTVLEIIAVLFVVYGLLHEDKFVAFEEQVVKFIRKKIYLHKRRKALERKRQQRVSRSADVGRPVTAVQRQRTPESRRVA